MYEAQVPNRTQSPAHYAEYLRVGLNLLGKQNVLESSRMGHLDVMTLLRSGVSVDLPEGKQILAYEVRPGSNYIGCQVQRCSKEAGEADLEIVVILRGQDVLLPNPETVFKQGDRLLVIASRQGRGWLDNHFIRLNATEKEEQKMS